MRDADDAVYELNGKELCGERVVIEHARGPRRDGYGYAGRSKFSRSSAECKYYVNVSNQSLLTNSCSSSLTIKFVTIKLSKLWCHVAPHTMLFVPISVLSVSLTADFKQ